MVILRHTEKISVVGDFHPRGGIKTIISDLPNKEAGMSFLYIIVHYKLIYNLFHVLF